MWKAQHQTYEVCADDIALVQQGFGPGIYLSERQNTAKQITHQAKPPHSSP